MLLIVLETLNNELVLENQKKDLKREELLKQFDAESFLWGFPNSTEKQKNVEISDLKEVEANRLKDETEKTDQIKH